MPTKKQDLDKADEQGATTRRVSSNRLKGAYQLGGIWHTADGGVLTDPKEIQQAHRAKDKADAEARQRAMLGGG